MILVHILSLYITFEHTVLPQTPPPLGEIYDDWLNPSSISYYIAWMVLILNAVITLIGFNKYRTFTSGTNRKRAIYIMIATPCFALAFGESIALGNLITPHEHLLWIIRFSMLIASVLILYGFRPLNKTSKVRGMIPKNNF